MTCQEQSLNQLTIEARCYRFKREKVTCFYGVFVVSFFRSSIGPLSLSSILSSLASPWVQLMGVPGKRDKEGKRHSLPLACSPKWYR